MKSVPEMRRPAPAALGRRLRSLRERRRLTVEQLADYAGLSKGFLSRVERDLTSPSVASLVSICQVLRVSPGEVLDTPEPTKVSLSEAPMISLGGDGITDRLLSPPGQHDLQLVRAVVAPGGVGESDMYTMDCEVEALHVISGSFVLKTEHGEYALQAGDTVTFPGTEPHTWENPGDEEAIVHWILVGRRSSSTLPLDTTRRGDEGRA
ncbi:helix-turn-helix domain-containing protein [Nesterenkonia marinintestina]|uniref:helix-turn-helix domain-containing protein n=1 Tax=Nesterenkonia marinintestina TaxID=2979865 RepID=UPI0021BE384E|nr:helix-turn-helix domain-containing protein [Nesterenkonia sp. GX14115]